MVSDTAEPEDRPEDASTKEPAPRPLRWESLNSDIRMLIVTVAGTLIANIVTTMTVAIAIVVARSPGLGLDVPDTILFTLLLVGAMIAIVMLGWLYRHRPPPVRFFRPTIIFMAVFTGLFATVMVLTLLGTAAGIKPK
jgi:hypothetical protein